MLFEYYNMGIFDNIITNYPKNIFQGTYLPDRVKGILDKNVKIIDDDIINFVDLVIEQHHINKERNCDICGLVYSLKLIERKINKFSDEVVIYLANKIVKTIQCMRKRYVYYDVSKFIESCRDWINLGISRQKHPLVCDIETEKILYTNGIDKQFSFLNKKNSFDSTAFVSRTTCLIRLSSSCGNGEDIMTFLMSNNEKINATNTQDFSLTSYNVHILFTQLAWLNCAEDQSVKYIKYLKKYYNYTLPQIFFLQIIEILASKTTPQYDSLEDEGKHKDNIKVNVFKLVENIIKQLDKQEIKIKINIKICVNEIISLAPYGIEIESILYILSILKDNKYDLLGDSKLEDINILGIEDDDIQYEFTKFLIDNFEYVPTKDLWLHCVTYCKTDLFKLIKDFPLKNIKLDKSIIGHTMKYINLEILKFLLDQKIFPDIQMIEDFCIFNKRKNKQDVINMLYEYNPAVVCACSEIILLSGITLPNKETEKDKRYLQIFNKILPNELKKYKNIDKVKKQLKSIKTLEILFGNNTLNDIKEYIEFTKLVPNLYCLENGLHNDCEGVLQYILDELKFAPTIVNIISVKDEMKRFYLLKKFYPSMVKIEIIDEESQKENQEYKEEKPKKMIKKVKNNTEDTKRKLKK